MSWPLRFLEGPAWNLICNKSESEFVFIPSTDSSMFPVLVLSACIVTVASAMQ